MAYLNDLASAVGSTNGSIEVCDFTLSHIDSVTASAGGGWLNTTIDTLAGAFTAEFDATPSLNPIDSVVGFSSGASTNFTNLAAIVRFNTTNNIDARNGGVYVASNAIPYTANTSYHFRLVIDVPSHTYSAYVTPAGGSEQVIGINYAFRSEQSSVPQLNNRATFMNSTNGALEVCNLTWLDSGLKTWLKLDEPVGTNAVDASGSGNNGTLINGPTWSASGVGGAMSLDGVDDHATLPSGQANFTGGLTVAVWAYPTTVKTNARFIDFGNGATNNNIILARNGSSNDLVFWVNNGTASGNKVVATNAIALNLWQHFAATVDASGNVKLYKNGSQVATGTTTVPVNVTRTLNYLGRSNTSADAYYNGFLDDVRIYNRVLTATEIQSLP